jgi:hypothetical protein
MHIARWIFSSTVRRCGSGRSAGIFPRRVPQPVLGRAGAGRAHHTFRAAVAFYPVCERISGPMPTLILIGENDDWTPADACRRLTNAEDEIGISRSKGEGAPLQLAVLPDATHGFDTPREKAISSPTTRRRRNRRATCCARFLHIIAESVGNRWDQISSMEPRVITGRRLLPLQLTPGSCIQIAAYR